MMMSIDDHVCSAINAFCTQVVDPANFIQRTNYTSTYNADLSDTLQDIIQFYFVRSMPHTRFFHIGPVDLYLYPSDQARINLSIPANDIISSPRDSPLLSLRQYLDQLDGFVSPTPPFVLNDLIDRPFLMDAFPVPRFSCDMIHPNRLFIQHSSQSVERVFAHPHIRAPLALLDAGHLVCAAYLSLPCLNDELAFHPHELDEFKRQFIAYQINILHQYFQALGVHFFTVDYKSVFLQNGWWVLVHLPLIESYNPVKEEKNDSERILSPFRQWAHGHVSNFDYLYYLNMLAGRSLNSMHIHPIMPWVTDFTTRDPEDSVGLRDLSMSKYRLSKGDEQLDMTYLAGDPPHHINTMLTDLSLCTLMARVLPECVLKLHIRERFSAAEVPFSAASTYAWTSDECIPEWYNDPTVIQGLTPSIHISGFKAPSDPAPSLVESSSLPPSLGAAPAFVPPLELPSWAKTSTEFICKHRELLESEAVSLNIHAWINIIFGHCLVGHAAILAKNVALPLAYPESKFASRHHGIRQLFTSPHPPRLIKGHFSLDDLEKIAAFDAKYFGPSQPLLIVLPKPVHPSLPYLYAYVLSARQKLTTSAWPATSAVWGPEAVEIAVHHALDILPLNDLMDRSWLRMHHSLFIQIFSPLLSSKIVPTQFVSSNTINIISPHRSTEFLSPICALQLAVQYLGPLVVLEEMWSPISGAIIDWDAKSFLDEHYIVGLAYRNTIFYLCLRKTHVCYLVLLNSRLPILTYRKLLGPRLTRSRMLPLFSILLRKHSTANLPEIFLNIGKKFGTAYMRQVLFPFLVGEAFHMCHSIFLFETITDSARAIVESIAASETVSPKFVNQITQFLKESVGRTHYSLISFALDLVQCVIDHDENKEGNNELISTLTTLCEVSVNSPKDSQIGDTRILLKAYTLVCSILGLQQVMSLFNWAATVEMRMQSSQTGNNSKSSLHERESTKLQTSHSASYNGRSYKSKSSRSIALTSISTSTNDLRVSRSSTANSIDSLLARSSGTGTRHTIQFCDGDAFASQIWAQSNEFTGRRLFRFPAHPGLQCVGYMTHSRHIVTGGRDKTVKLWNIDGIFRDLDLNSSMQPAQSYVLHQDSITEVCDFGPYVLSCDGTIHVWDVVNAQSVTQITSKHSLGLVQPWSNRRLVVGASTNNTVFVNDIRTRSAPLHFATGVGFSGTITAVAISKNTVAVGSSFGAISLLDIHMGLLLATWRAHDAGITKLLFINAWLISVSYGSNALFIWNAVTYTLLNTFKISYLTDISSMHSLDEEASTILAMDSSRNLATIAIREVDSYLKISVVSKWKPLPSRVQSSVLFVDDSMPIFITGGYNGQLSGFV